MPDLSLIAGSIRKVADQHNQLGFFCHSRLKRSHDYIGKILPRAVVWIYLSSRALFHKDASHHGQRLLAYILAQEISLGGNHCLALR